MLANRIFYENCLAFARRGDDRATLSRFAAQPADEHVLHVLYVLWGSLGSLIFLNLL